MDENNVLKFEKEIERTDDKLNSIIKKIDDQKEEFTSLKTEFTVLQETLPQEIETQNKIFKSEIKSLKWVIGISLSILIPLLIFLFGMLYQKNLSLDGKIDQMNSSLGDKIDQTNLRIDQMMTARGLEIRTGGHASGVGRGELSNYKEVKEALVPAGIPGSEENLNLEEE